MEGTLRKVMVDAVGWTLDFRAEYCLFSDELTIVVEATDSLRGMMRAEMAV